MLYYKPPKSSIWGHKLRKMRPDRQRKLTRDFFAEGVSEYKFEIGSLTILSSSAQLIQRFERLLKVTAYKNQFSILTQRQCQKCIDEIIKEPSFQITRQLLLLQCFVISKWRIHNKKVVTNSRIMLFYGLQPCMSTFLQFNSHEEFLIIKNLLLDLGLCKLNEKHLKERSIR